MGEERRNMEGNFLVKAKQHLWGFRAWKRHSLILTVAGFIYILIGAAYVLAAPNEAREVALQILLRIAPLHFWGGVFIFAGLLSIVSSKWPPLVETWGYMVLTGLSMGWGSTYLMGILFGNSPWVNINGCLLWSLLGFLWWAISGLANPEKLVVATRAARPN